MRISTYIKRKVKPGIGIQLKFDGKQLPTSHKSYKDVLSDTLAGKFMIGYLWEWQKSNLQDWFTTWDNKYIKYEGLPTFRTSLIFENGVIYLIVHTQILPIQDMQFEYALWSQFMRYVADQSGCLETRFIWSIEELV